MSPPTTPHAGLPVPPMRWPKCAERYHSALRVLARPRAEATAAEMVRLLVGLAAADKARTRTRWPDALVVALAGYLPRATHRDHRSRLRATADWLESAIARWSARLRYADDRVEACLG